MAMKSQPPLEWAKPLHRLLLESGCKHVEEAELEKAAAAFLRAAKLGNPEAQVNLANAFDAGEGVPEDFDAARHWYRRAAHNGVPEGAFNLAVAYRARGRERMAMFWFHRAAAMGDADALRELNPSLSKAGPK